MTFHFTTCHSYLMLHSEMLFFRLNPRIKNGWFTGNPNQHSRAHSGGIWARHSRDKGATRQADQIDWGTKTYMDPHSIHCNQARILWYSIIIFIQVMNLGSQSGATFHRRFITRIGSPMRLLRQSVQLLGRRPNLLILRTVQETISGNQKGIEKRNDWILFQSHTLSYFPNY